MAERPTALLQGQRAFAAALRDAAQTEPALHLFKGEQALVQRRLAIYRGNAVGAVAKALAAAYPVIVQIVGEEFFGGLARAHLRECPSTSGDLYDYGAGFAQFLAQFPPVAEFAYLPDLARLEWAAHRAYAAADAPLFDLQALARVPAAQQAGLRFQLAPGTALIRSAHPIVRLWTIHQDGYDGEFSVDWDRAETALVTRRGLDVLVSAVGPGMAMFLAGLLGGASLERAARLASDADAGFELAAALGAAVRANLICGFASPEGANT
ncbi:MAG TPA: DNA-binding domain-containing protein [Methylibium sp.]